MSSLRNSIILVVAWLAVVLNLDRINSGLSPVNDFSIHPAVYVLVVGIIFATLMVTRLQKANVYLVLSAWSGVYLVTRMAFLWQSGSATGLIIYVTITELALLYLTVIIARDLAQNLSRFEQVIEKVTMAGLGKRIYPLEDAGDDIKTEFSRSRRHNRPLTIMVVEPVSGSLHTMLHRTIQEIQTRMVKRFTVASLGQVIGKETRRTDLILEQAARDRYIILCPESSVESSSVLANRIRESAQERLGLTVSTGSACFPSDALSFDDLLLKAELNSHLPVLPLEEYEPVEMPVENVR